MARIDEKSFVLPTEVLQLDGLVCSELETYAPVLAERRLLLHWEAGSGISVRANREYLQQLLHMLLDNAVQYADEGGEINVVLEKKRRKVRMVFSNTVQSLPDCPPEALFDRFYRGNSARTQSSGGCGIGLSAARAITEMHRGTICAEYENPNIIRFTVELPA